MCVWLAGTRKELRPSTEVANKLNTPSGQDWPRWPKLTAPWSSDGDELVKALLALLVTLPLLAVSFNGAVRGLVDMLPR